MDGYSTKSFGQRMAEKGFQTPAPTYANYAEQRKDEPSNIFMSGLRELSGLLEPLQLPKDFMDAILAGAIDPNTTVSERLGRLDFASYIPRGKEPVRATTGKEIFKLIGVKDELTKNVGGFAFDIVADPFILAPVLKGVGLLAKAEKLVMFADKLDNAITLGSAYKGFGKVFPSAKRYLDDTALGALKWVTRPLTDPSSVLNRGAIPILDNLLPKRRTSLANLVNCKT
jgi:hypothetical protein